MTYVVEAHRILTSMHFWSKAATNGNPTFIGGMPLAWMSGGDSNANGEHTQKTFRR